MNKTLRKYLLMIFVLIVIGNLMSFILDPSLAINLKNILTNSLFSVIIGFPMMKLSEFIARKVGSKIKWEVNPGKRIAVTLGVVIIVSIAVTFLLNYIFLLNMEGTSFSEYIKTTINLLLLQILLIVYVFSLFTGIYFFRMWKEGLIRQESLKHKAMELQLEALKNQVNPHFLFNSLNTLTTLVHKDPDLAVNLIIQLSDSYRYLLEQKDKKTVEWSVEKHYVENYINLNQMRFANNIRVKIDTRENENFYVVPLSVQMLVENAIKHNIISSDEPLFINIYLSGDYLVVRNNLQVKSALKKAVNIGLENIKMQFELLSDRKVEVSAGEGHFTVKLPMITRKV